MDREAYNACMRPHMTGKGKTRDDRQRSMCIGAKLCTGKATTKEEAEKICSQPKPPGEPRSVRRRKKGKDAGSLRAVLLTSDNCTPCNIMREKLKKPLASGEVTEINSTRNPEQAERFLKDFKVKVPSVLVLSSDGQLIASSS